MLRLLRACAIVCLATILSGCDLVDRITSPSPGAPGAPALPAAGQTVRYTALGASDALGIGGSVQCAPFSACENGTGYVQIVTRQLRSGREVTLTNLGIPAAVLSPTIQEIARRHGRDVPANFVDREMPFVPTDTTLVTIFGGANDVNALGDAIERGAAGSTDPRTYIDAQIAAFGADADRLVRGVRERAPAAYIIVLNLPNLAGLPYASGYSLARRQGLQKISVGFSRELNRQAGTGVAVVDLMCDAQFYDRSRFSSDGFHPSDAGYAHLASKIMAVVNGGASAPASSCPQMTLVSPL